MPHRRMLTRRRLLLSGGVALTTLALPVGVLGQMPTADGFRDLRARPARAALGSGGETDIWGYDGTVPGPTIRVKRGQEVRVRLLNELPEPTTIHWHGLRLPNAMDGVPHLTQAPVEPGGHFDYRFTAPDAGTFWYHPHLYSSEQLERGLSGLLIVDEPDPPDVDHDIALIFDDWRLTSSGAIDEASFRSFHDAAHDGRIGRHVTVNGRPAFDIPVRTNQRLRLRLVNVANARLMRIGIDGHPARVMAVDGQPAEPFVARDSSVVLAPGTRIDLFVDAAQAPGAMAPIRLSGYGEDVAVARLVYASGAPARTEPRPEPAPLPANPLPQRMDFVAAAKHELPIEGGAMGGMMMGRGMGPGMGMGPGRGPGMGMGPGMRGQVPGDGIDPRARIWTLGGRASSGHHGPPAFSVKRGQTVMLAFANRTAFPHAMHLHGHHFRLLDKLDDGWKPFWLDTVLVAPMDTARIAFVADNPGKWMIHCHMLEHQETGMGAWFEVT